MSAFLSIIDKFANHVVNRRTILRSTVENLVIQDFPDTGRDAFISCRFELCRTQNMYIIVSYLPLKIKENSSNQNLIKEFQDKGKKQSHRNTFYACN